MEKKYLLSPLPRCQLCLSANHDEQSHYQLEDDGPGSLYAFKLRTLRPGMPRGIVKLGYSRHPLIRLNNLQVRNEVEYDVLAIQHVPLRKHAEYLLHRKQKSRRIVLVGGGSGFSEWFQLSDEETVAAMRKTAAATWRHLHRTRCSQNLNQ
jgi:hypothetical protein